MGNRHSIQAEIQTAGSVTPVYEKYVKELTKLTGRNTLAYYSGFQIKTHPEFAHLIEVNDDDMLGLMTCMFGMDFTKGVNLILHTPGGSVAAAEAISRYLRAKFGANIHVFVPELSMSAGTMIAFLGQEIWMGAHSSLGPIDPHFNGMPAREVLAEFKRAKEEVKKDPTTAAIWQPILARYYPSFIGKCENVLKLSEEVARNSLETGMFASVVNPAQRARKAKAVASKFLDLKFNLTHDRHLSPQRCQAAGLVIRLFEDEQKIQNCILPLHHLMKIMLDGSQAAKIIINQHGVHYIRSLGYPLTSTLSPANGALPTPADAAPAQFARQA